MTRTPEQNRALAAAMLKAQEVYQYAPTRPLVHGTIRPDLLAAAGAFLEALGITWPPEDTDGALASVLAELGEHDAHGYTREHDDAHGAADLARIAGTYLHRARARGNRSDLVKAASVIIAAIRTVDRLASFGGTAEDTVEADRPEVEDDQVWASTPDMVPVRQPYPYEQAQHPEVQPNGLVEVTAFAIHTLGADPDESRPVATATRVGTRWTLETPLDAGGLAVR